MVKSIYLVNIPYIGRLYCHLLISIQTLIFQPQFTLQTLILCLGDLYYEGKVKKAIFPQNFMYYVLRTTPTHHMVGFIDFYFHFLPKFPDLKFASYVLYIYLCHVTWHTQWAGQWAWVSYDTCAHIQTLTLSLPRGLPLMSKIVWH